MAESTAPKTRFLGTITVTPGSGTPYTVAVESGNLKINGLTAGNKQPILVEDRGEFHTLVDGSRKYPTFTLTAVLRDLVDSADTTLVGVCLKLGPYAAATSTLGASRPWTVDLLWTIAGLAVGDAADHTATLEDCRIEDVNFSEGDVNEVEISGICYGAITLT
jgi:hypothetical protein